MSQCTCTTKTCNWCIKVKEYCEISGSPLKESNFETFSEFWINIKNRISDWDAKKLENKCMITWFHAWSKEKEMRKENADLKAENTRLHEQLLCAIHTLEKFSRESRPGGFDNARDCITKIKSMGGLWGS